MPAVLRSGNTERNTAIVAPLRVPPESRPARMVTTCNDCVSITTGAINPARMLSNTKLVSSRNVPPQPRRSARVIAMAPSNLGISSKAMVPTNIHMARTGSITGHCGNSERPAGK